MVVWHWRHSSQCGRPLTHLWPGAQLDDPEVQLACTRALMQNSHFQRLVETSEVRPLVRLAAQSMLPWYAC